MAQPQRPTPRAGAQGRVLILINGKAKYAKRQGALALKQKLEALVAAQGLSQQVQIAITQTHEALHQTLQAHAPTDQDLVVPVGGDGTLGTVLTALWHLHGKPLHAANTHANLSQHRRPSPTALPALLAVHAGTMNQIANDIAPARCPLKAIGQALAQWASQGGLPGLPTTTRYALCINQAHLGFAFGYGASAHFLQAYNAQGGGVKLAWRLIAQHAWHALRGSWCLPAQLGLALSVRKLPLGVKFSTSGGPQAQANFCWVHGQSVRWGRLALQLPWVWWGKLPANTGLQRSTQQQVCIQENQAQPWHLDGDLHPPCLQINIAVGPAVRFIGCVKQAEHLK